MLEQISYRYLREGALREASETGGLENVPYYVGLPIFSRIAHIIFGVCRDIRAYSAASMQPRMQLLRAVH